MRRPRVHCTCCSSDHHRCRQMGDTPPEKNSSYTSASASAKDCSSSTFSRSSSTVSSNSGSNARNTTRSSSSNASRSPRCRASNSSTGSASLTSSNGSRGAAYSRTGSARSRRRSRHTDGTGFLAGTHYVDAWKTSGRSCSCSATASGIPDARTGRAGLGAVEAAASSLRAEPPTPTPVSASTQGHMCSCRDRGGEGTAGLWNAFFAEGTDLGLLLLQEMQRQMRAEHLQEEKLLTLSHATASSLPIWLNLRRILQTASAAASAAAGAATPSARLTALQESAADTSSLRTSLPEAPASIAAGVFHANAIIPPVGVSNTDDKSVRPGAVAKSSALSDACASFSGAAAPPVAGVLLRVDKVTLRTVLQLLPLLAFKESERLLRHRETATEPTHGAEAGCYMQPRQLLGADTCDAMVCRLNRMLHHWKKLVSSVIYTHTRSNNICNGNISRSNSCSYQIGHLGIDAVLGRRFSNAATAGGRSSYTCRSNSSHTGNTSSNHRSCTTRIPNSEASTSETECCVDNRVGTECTCNSKMGDFIVFADKALQQLLLQLLYPQALITAVIWGRQLHLHEQRRCPLEIHGHTQTRLSSTHEPRHVHLFQRKEQEEPETLQQLNEFRHPPQDKPRASQSGSLMSKGRSSQAEMRGPQQSERMHKPETQRQEQRPQVRQRPQREYLEEGTLQVCLQKLLRLLQRPRTARKGGGNPHSVTDTLQYSQRQQELILLYLLQLLCFCGVRGEVRQDTHGDSQSVAGRSVLEVGNQLDKPEHDEEKKQQRRPQRCRQQHWKRDAEQHVPVCFGRATPAAVPSLRTVHRGGCNLGVLERFQFAAASACRGGRDTSSGGVDEVSMRLCYQLLLCDSQLYIHLATPPRLLTEGEELPSWRHTYGSVPLQTASTQEAPQNGGQTESPAAAPAQQFGCSLADNGASVGTASGDVTPAGTAPAAMSEKVAACVPSERAAAHALSAETSQGTGEVSAEETAARRPPAKKAGVANATRRPEARADEFAGRRLSPGACKAAHSSAAPFIPSGHALSDRAFSICFQKSSSVLHSQKLTHLTALSEDSAKINLPGAQPSNAGGEEATCAALEQAEDSVDSGTHHLIDCSEGQRLLVAARHSRGVGSLRHAEVGSHNLARDQCIHAGAGYTCVPPVHVPRSTPAATVVEGSAIGCVRVDRPNCSMCSTCSRFAPTAPTACVQLCVCPCVECRSRRDSAAAVTASCKVVTGDEVSLPFSGTEVHLAAAEAPRPSASNRVGKPCKSGFENELARAPKGEAAVANAVLSHHCYVSSGVLSSKICSTGSACGHCTTRCSAQLRSSFFACKEEEESHRALQGTNSTVAVSCENLNLCSNATALSGTTFVGLSQHTLSTVTPARRQCQDMRSRDTTCSEYLLGHPQELELSFRPAVLRVSLLRTRGSFRSFFRTYAHTSRLPGAIASGARELQRQLAPQPQAHQQQHDFQGVDLSFRLPDPTQQHTHESQTMFAPGESQSRVGSGSSAAGCSDAVTNTQAAEQVPSVTEYRATVTAPGSPSLTGAPQSIRPSQAVHVTKTALVPETLNLLPRCWQCSCCGSSDGCGTHVERARHSGNTLHGPQQDVHAVEACSPFEGCNACFTQGAGTPDAVEPEDLLVCCFFESGAVTLNGRVVRFFDNGDDGACFPCIVDVLLLSWYGADPLLSEPPSPPLLPASQLCAAFETHSSVATGQYTPSTISTCSSSSSANNGGGALSGMHASNSSSSSGSGNSSSSTWRSFVGTSLTRQDSGNNRCSSSSYSLSPALECGSSGQRAEETPASSTRDVDVALRSGYPLYPLASQMHQQHVCLLFLAANGTLFCSGDVPSVYLPRCVTCGDSPPCKGRSCRAYPVPFNNSTSATASDSGINDNRVHAAGRDQCEAAPRLTTPRYGTLYSAVWLPAVCAATRRPLLFGAMLASNPAAVALTSNLLLPRYKRRMPLHQRQLSCNLLIYDPSTCIGSFPMQREEVWRSIPVDSLLPHSFRVATEISARTTRHGYQTHAGGFAELEETSVQWKKAAAAAGSGAAVAVLQTHTGEPVLLQQHRQEVQTAATSAIWRGGAAARGDAFRSSEIPPTNTETFQRRRSQSGEGISPVVPAELAGFILRFVTLPDLRKCPPLQPSSSSSTSKRICSICCSERAHVESRNAACRRESFKRAREAQVECTEKAPDFTSVIDGVLKKTAGQPVFRVGWREDTTRVRMCGQGGVRQKDTFYGKEKLEDFLHYRTADSEEMRSLPPALSFLLDERWVACSLYKDLVLLKTAGHTRHKTGLLSVGVLLSNLEKELHEWLADFFESHPHVLRGAKYMRLGFERVSTRGRKRCLSPLLKLSTAAEQRKHERQQDQQPVRWQHLSTKHEEESRPHGHRRRNLGSYGQCERRDQQQQDEHLHYEPDQQSTRLQMQQQLSKNNQNCKHSSAAQVHQGTQTECESFPSVKASLSSSRIKSILQVVSVVAPESVSEYGSARVETEIRARPPYAGDATSSTLLLPTMEQLTGEQEPRSKQLQREVENAAAAKGSCDANEEIINLEEEDGELRLFVNTAEGSFYCLNLQRRCLETAWPEEPFEVRHRNT